MPVSVLFATYLSACQLTPLCRIKEVDSIELSANSIIVLTLSTLGYKNVMGVLLSLNWAGTVVVIAWIVLFKLEHVFTWPYVF